MGFFLLSFVIIIADDFVLLINIIIIAKTSEEGFFVKNILKKCQKIGEKYTPEGVYCLRMASFLLLVFFTFFSDCSINGTCALMRLGLAIQMVQGARESKTLHEVDKKSEQRCFCLVLAFLATASSFHCQLVIKIKSITVESQQPLHLVFSSFEVPT